MPEWYEFYDAHIGTGALLLLPDARGEKEKEYERVYYDWYRNSPPLPSLEILTEPPPLQPIFAYDGSMYTEFMERFENDYLCRLHQGWLVEKHQKPDEYYSHDAICDAIRELEGAEEPIYMDGGQVWYEAIVSCAQKFKNRKVAALLEPR
jgi:hypothetical protein